jgi:glycerol kinase
MESEMPAYLLAIDQGTMSSRAMIFNHLAQVIAEHHITSTSFYPHDGWVEQDPEVIWKDTLLCCQKVLDKAQLGAKNISAVGISNQRETTLIWDKKTGEPIYPAIIWQDRRGVSLCKALAELKISAQIQEKTGLRIDPYFSAIKILWLLENIPHARTRAEKGELAFGTIDTFLLWRLTKGKSHYTDATNASRTLLFNLDTQTWDKDILSAFNIPESLLPVVLDSAAFFGEMDAEFLGSAIPVSAMIGDQQAATVGQSCFQTGMLKVTYGTGCFLLINTGAKKVISRHQLLTTIAYRLDGKVTYGLEGSIFSAGVIVKWLRDTLKIIHSAEETETLANFASDTAGVYLVPAFAGLGAPYWDPEARGAILGLTSSTRIEHIVRAALEAVCYQTRDLLECMQRDGVNESGTLRVDGGMAANNWLCQFLADMVTRPVQRPLCIETTALGAAFLAGLQIGLYQSLSEISQLWQAAAIFTPQLDSVWREHLYDDWKKAVARVLTHS